MRFGRLLVESYASSYISAKGRSYERVNCLCDCGNRKELFITNVGHPTISCGCYQREGARERIIHGATSAGAPILRKKLYNVWASMWERCTCPTHTVYADYGGRGITVCQEWGEFLVFERDMADGYSPELELDRVENSFGYSKSNCRWATRTENMRHTRASRMHSAFGETMCLAAWAERCGIRRHTIQSRIDRGGWDFERAITTPVSNGK